MPFVDHPAGKGVASLLTRLRGKIAETLVRSGACLAAHPGLGPMRSRTCQICVRQLPGKSTQVNLLDFFYAEPIRKNKGQLMYRLSF